MAFRTQEEHFRLWARFRVELGMSKEEFHSLSSTELTYLVEAITARNTRSDFAVAQLCAMTYNMNRKKGSKALTATDFIPNTGVKKTQMSETDIMSVIAAGHKQITGENLIGV